MDNLPILPEYCKVLRNENGFRLLRWNGTKLSYPSGKPPNPHYEIECSNNNKIKYSGIYYDPLKAIKLFNKLTKNKETKNGR